MHVVDKLRILPVLAGAAVVVVGLNVASYAATGHALTLGAKNTESRTTTLATSGKGAALSLTSGKRSPSLAVSSSALVAHLNADRVDGEQAADLQTQATTWTIPADTKVSYTLNGLRTGTYLASFSVLLGDTKPTSQCELDEDGVAVVNAIAPNRAGTFAMVDGTGILTHAAGHTLQLVCDGVEVLNNPASTVTMVRLDHVTTGTLTADTP
jgi:protoporphyrinogen oxidase